LVGKVESMCKVKKIFIPMDTELLPRMIFLRFIVTKVVSFTALLVTLQIVRAVVFNFRAKFVKLFAALAV